MQHTLEDIIQLNFVLSIDVRLYSRGTHRYPIQEQLPIHSIKAS